MHNCQTLWIVKIILKRRGHYAELNVFVSTGNRGFSIGIGDVTPGYGLIKAKNTLLDEGLDNFSLNKKN